jgi:hypothetical protein
MKLFSGRQSSQGDRANSEECPVVHNYADLSSCQGFVDVVAFTIQTALPDAVDLFDLTTRGILPASARLAVRWCTLMRRSHLQGPHADARSCIPDGRRRANSAAGRLLAPRSSRKANPAQKPELVPASFHISTLPLHRLFFQAGGF